MTQRPEGAALIQQLEGVEGLAVDDLLDAQPPVLPPEPNDFAVLHLGEKTKILSGSKIPHAGVLYDALRSQRQHKILRVGAGVAELEKIRLDAQTELVGAIADGQPERRLRIEQRSAGLGDAAPIGIRAVKLKAEGGPEVCGTDGGAALHFGVAVVFSGHGQPPGGPGGENIPQLTLEIGSIPQDAPGNGAGHPGDAAALHGGTHLLVALTSLQLHRQIADGVDAVEHACLVAEAEALAAAGGKDGIKHRQAPPFPVRIVLRASGQPLSALWSKYTG